MARLEMPEFTPAGLGEGPVTADTMFELGMMYASGREVPVDLVTAHKWFNIAAMKGHAEAAQLRREIAAEMKDAEIGQAQRAARDWLKAHPEPVVQQADGSARRGLESSSGNPSSRPDAPFGGGRASGRDAFSPRFQSMFDAKPPKL